MTHWKGRRIASGLVLVVLGLALFVLQDLDRTAVFFFLGGGVFLAAYFHKREFGFLIPGCLMLGLGAGVLMHEVVRRPDATMVGIGFGFVAIVLVGLLYERTFRGWPLIPGGILLVLGFADRNVFKFLFHNWPLLLVITGILVMLGAFGRPSSARSPE